MSEEGKNEIELGGRSNWAGIRAAEAFLFFVACPALYWLKPPGGIELGVAVAAAVLVAVVWDPVALGFADAKGVRYRHYFGWNNLSWADVERIDWSSAWIVIVRKEGFPLRRRLVFPLARSMKTALDEALGRTLPEPAAVTAVKEFLGACGVEVKGVERARPKHAMVALAIFLLLAVGIAWAWWTWLKP